MVFPEYRNGILRLAVAGVIAIMLTGCATTFIPISWGMRDKVLHLSQQDEVLGILFRRYDPERKTLRVDGASFDIVEMTHENWKFVGAYRQEHWLIYRNLEANLDGQDLRNVLLHELAHHIWFRFLTAEQKEGWRQHLRKNPSRWQVMVRRLYKYESLYDTEDFAYTVEFPRKADIEALAGLAIITEEEMKRWLRAGDAQDIQGSAGWTEVAVPRQ